jgi:hypothetical protein
VFANWSIQSLVQADRSKQKGIDLFYSGGILVSDMTTQHCAPETQPAHVLTLCIR